MNKVRMAIAMASLSAVLVFCAGGCASSQGSPATSVSSVDASSISGFHESESWSDIQESEEAVSSSASSASSQASEPSSASSSKSAADAAEELRSKLDIAEDYRDAFVHGEKPVKYQEYIVLHDTEGEGEPEDIISYWDGSGEGVAAHFVIGKDGHIAQCVPLEKIAHHAGFGDAGHNDLYGVTDESRDDKVGTVSIGDWAPDYGMNSYSVGIELIHVGGEGEYPEEQLEALDGLIAYIDAYFGKESTIIDHKAWRSGNSDTSEEFAEYLANYQDHRTHD